MAITRHTLDTFGLLDEILQAWPKQTNFPPYTLLSSKDDSKIIIEVAVAGFKQNELSIAAEEHRLIISGKRQNAVEDVKVHHQGIAKRSFDLKFAKQPEYEISDANLEDGVLTIVLEKRVAEQKSIPIRTGQIDTKRLLVE